MIEFIFNGSENNCVERRKCMITAGLVWERVKLNQEFLQLSDRKLGNIFGTEEHAYKQHFLIF